MKRQWILLLWLAGILLPMAWLAQFIPGYNQLFNFVFGPAWMHWISHGLLFAVLSFLLLTILASGQHTGWPRIALVFAIVLAAAILQESFQLWYKARPWGSDEWFDLAVDMTGALLGALAWWGLRRRRLNQRQSRPG